ncbi:pyridoxamine 5'-phosphate oxidase family protein [Rhizobium sp. L1K21]|uniref:pyridoxamine 5'-phosphate oxidase family protein n=1 Tax=Rhizobium sp. L1K21 TaxID=2954933 RepID=UPI002093A996|nr:pyridoxamine 5'-phosphate oxidase family protein [Rhizobium sp. L1K21]MCO6185074.1 pyridoxamine 5'-phosphate oxidase family protein [Rhizobium sp. L1K21]
MVSLTKTRERPEEQLWDELEKVHAGMLGVQGSPHPMQPMAPQCDRGSGTIWFFTKTDVDLVKDIQPGTMGTFCLVGKDHDYFATITGVLDVRRDEKVIEEHWSAMVEAWFEDGKDDPKLTLIEFRVQDADVWASTSNVVKLGWEVAKANLNEDETPEVGVQRHLKIA